MRRMCEFENAVRELVGTLGSAVASAILIGSLVSRTRAFAVAGASRKNVLFSHTISNKHKENLINE